MKGEEGDGLNIAWRQGFQKGYNSGPTHSGMGGFPAERVDQQTISFARIFGNSQDLGLVSRRDYVYLEGFSSGEGEYTYRFHAWKNTGYGGTKIKCKYPYPDFIPLQSSMNVYYGQPYSFGKVWIVIAFLTLL